MSDTRIKVCFATLTAGSPQIHHVNSVLSVMSPDSLGSRYEVVGTINGTSGPYLDVGRNDLVLQALERTDADWFIWLDDDIEFTADAARALLDAAIDSGHDIASGPYACIDPHFGLSICAYRLTPYDPDTHPERLAIAQLADGRFFHPIPLDACPTSPTEVSSFGAGFMATSRALLDLMRAHFAPPQPWFAEMVVPGIDGGMWLGEDHIFCLRASHLNRQPLLVPDARVTHIKRMKLAVPDPTRTYPWPDICFPPVPSPID